MSCAAEELSCSSTLSRRVAVAKALVQTNSASVDAAAKHIVESGLSGRGVSVATCREALSALKSMGGTDSDVCTQWISSVKERYPYMTDLA